MVPDADAENELTLLAKAYEALAQLDDEGRARGIAWLSSMLGLQSYRSPNGIGALPVPSGTIAPNGRRREGTINTVCARMGVKSCRELFIAAAAHLALYEGQDRFARSAWIARAKESKSWKTDYSVQMATAMTRLLNNGFVNEVAKDEFAIPDDQLRQLENRLGE